MKLKILTIFTTLAIFTIFIFGFFILNFTSHQGQTNCLLFSVSEADCSLVSGSVSIAFHHISGIQNLILTLVNSSNFFFTVLFIFIYFINLLFLKKLENLKLFLSNFYFLNLKSLCIQKNKLLRWLILKRQKKHRFIFLFFRV